jgi:hypothetical protein
MAEQPNRSWFEYTSDAGAKFSIMTDPDWGQNAASGLAAFVSSDPAWGPQSRFHRLRHVIYKDPATLRTARFIFGTTAAYGAAPATQSVFIPGNVAAVVYNLASRQPERMRIAGPSAMKIDHA